MDPAPGLVVVGHLTLDASDGGYRLGGAAYAATTGVRLGYRVGLVTSFGPDLEPILLAPEILAVNRQAPASTIFRNSYLPSGPRRQKLLARALPLQEGQIPAAWHDSPLLLNPVADEIGPEFLEALSNPLVAVCPQGWMRRWEDDGQIEPVPWSWAGQALPRLDAVIVSIEDLEGDWALASDWASLVPCMVVTCGAEGSWVYFDGCRRHVPACPSDRVVDPTGAGDAFAAAFVLKYRETGDPMPAARFASLVARFVVEAPGLDGVPDSSTVTQSWRRMASQ